MCAAIILGVDATPVLDFGEQVLDQVALFCRPLCRSDIAPCGWISAGCRG